MLDLLYLYFASANFICTKEFFRSSLPFDWYQKTWIWLYLIDVDRVSCRSHHRLFSVACRYDLYHYHTQTVQNSLAILFQLQKDLWVVILFVHWDLLLLNLATSDSSATMSCTQILDFDSMQFMESTKNFPWVRLTTKNYFLPLTLVSEYPNQLDYLLINHASRCPWVCLRRTGG